MTSAALTNAVDHTDLVSCAVGPLGAVSRFVFAKMFNGKIPENH